LLGRAHVSGANDLVHLVRRLQQYAVMRHNDTADEGFSNTKGTHQYCSKLLMHRNCTMGDVKIAQKQDELKEQAAG
jgi:hypothetical protein